MNIEKIQKAITKMSPDELARFRAWFKEYGINVKSREVSDSQIPSRDLIRKFRGSFKGSGAMKALMEERRKG